MIDKALSRIDLLGIPIILNFSRSKKVRSSFGGSWTLAFFGFVIWALYNSGSELWQKKKPQMTEGVRFNPSLNPLELSSETVPIMFYPSLNPLTLSEAEFLNSSVAFIYNFDYTAYIATMKSRYDAARYFQCNFTYLIQDTASSDGISGTWLDMEPCTQAHFAGFDGIIDSKTENLIQYSYCLPIQSYGLVYGFSLSLYCPQQTNTYFFLQQNPTLELYYPKYGLSLQNYTHPTQPYLYNYRMQLGPDSTGPIYSYWDMNYLDITTDQGWLTTSEKTDHYVQVTPTANSDIVMNAQRIERILVFKLSKEEIRYTRTYTKLQNVLAEVGGLAGSVLGVLLLFITPFARVKLSEAFVNEMFESRTEYEPKTPDEKGKTMRKKSKKNLKRTNTANRSYLDRKSTVTINLQSLETEPLETTERNNKSPSKEIIPMKLKSQNSGILGDESPLMKTGRTGDPKSPQTEPKVIPQVSKKSFSFSVPENVKKTVSAPPNIKKSFSEFDEIPTPAQSAAQTIESHTFKSGFGHKNPFSGGDQNKNIGTGIEVQDLEKSEINLEFTSSPIESPLKTEGDGDGDGDGEEEHMRKKGEIESQQDLGRNANQVIEDESRKLRKDGVFGTLQLALPTKPKKIQKPKVINITFFEYLKSFVYKSESTGKKMKIIDRALKMLDSRLDVFNLLKKLRDIDKMKGLFLDKDQVYLFDRLSRPDIWDPLNHWYQEEYLSYYEILKGANELEELEVKAHIKESKRALENKPEKSEVDEKILGLI